MPLCLAVLAIPLVLFLLHYNMLNNALWPILCHCQYYFSKLLFFIAVSSLLC